MGLLEQQCINAVLALYGFPQPHGKDTADDIAQVLNFLATTKREGAMYPGSTRFKVQGKSYKEIHDMILRNELH